MKLSLKELGIIILFTIILIGFFLPFGSVLYDQAVPIQNRNAREDLKLIANTIEAQKEIAMPESQVTASITFEDPAQLFAYNEDYNDLPRECKKQSCVCLILEETQKEICQTIKTDIATGEIAQIKPDTYVFNFQVTKEDKDFNTDIAII